MKPRLFIVTGGQTGVDRAAMDVALDLKLPLRGWCPKGRLAEDGLIAPLYPMQETDSEDVAIRTEWNVRDSDATWVLSCGKPSDGTPLTSKLAKQYDRPLLETDITADLTEDLFIGWLQKNNVRILNIAGPRESHNPGYVYSSSRILISRMLSRTLSS